MAHEPYVGNDIYCDWILSGKLPVDVVAETEEVLAFHHSRPFWPVHLVVIPKAHTPSLVDLGDGSISVRRLDALDACRGGRVCISPSPAPVLPPRHYTGTCHGSATAVARSTKTANASTKI